MHLQGLITTAAVLTLVSALPSLTRRENSQPPSQDPFYQPPYGYESAEPGVILKSRQKSSAYNDSATSYQLLFRSTDSNGKPSAVVTTIYVPPNPDKDKLLSVQEPYVSADVDCSPSFTNQSPTGDFANDTVIYAALQKGWFVSLSDYEGFEAASTNGVQSGQAVLDSIRAALSSENITGLACDATVTMQGYSGGGLASEWALELQPSYAPELKIAGAAIGGLPSNITNAYFHLMNAPYSALIPNSIIGMTAQNATMRVLIENNLFSTGPYNATGFNSVLHECFISTLAMFGSQDFNLFFKDGGAFFTQEPFFGFQNKYAVVGQRDVPTVPFYAYKGVLDQITPIEDTDQTVQNYCSRGASIQYARNATADHFTEMVSGVPAAFEYLVERMEGIPQAKGCNITNVS